MDQQEVNKKIVDYLSYYNPQRIGLFGSYVRGEESDKSDIDILVRFKNTLSLLDLAKIHRELSEELGKKVDIVTEASLKNEKLKSYIYRDLKIIFE